MKIFPTLADHVFRQSFNPDTMKHLFKPAMREALINARRFIQITDQTNAHMRIQLLWRIIRKIKALPVLTDG